MVIKKLFLKQNYENVAPQLVHFFSLSNKQHKRPSGKNRIAQRSPRQVKSSSNIPTRHAGHAPTMITSGSGTIIVVVCVAPYDGTE